MNKTALIVAEHDSQKINPSTLKTITAAKVLATQIKILVVGYNCNAIADELAKIEGVGEILVVDHETLQHPLAEPLTEIILACDNIDYYLAPATTFGKNILPRVAAKLDIAQISDIIAIKDQDTFVRPIYAGNAIATVKSLDVKKVITVRTTAFEAATAGSMQAKITTLEIVPDSGKSTFVKAELTKSDRPELTSARVVISGGRGLQQGENFKLLEALAEKLNAAIGASRAAVDAGFVPNDYQVGQTGKVVAPELYIAIGISGAIQHLAGMKDSKVIVAINQDADAPIFQIADYGLVGDLFEIVPQLTEALT